MNSVRAKTVVVGQPKPQDRWPLERAKLINRHRDSIRAAHAEAKNQRAYGRDEGQREVWEKVAENADFMKYAFREAASQIGEMMGTAIAADMDACDPVFAEKKRFFDMRLAQAQMSIEPRYRQMENTTEVMTRIDLPPHRLDVAFPVPETVL